MLIPKAFISILSIFLPMRTLGVPAAARLHRRGPVGTPVALFRPVRDAIRDGDMAGKGTDYGVGASITRLEDDRYLRGRGRYVADIRMPGMLDITFVRSPVAHGRIRSIAKPADGAEDVFVAADLNGVTGIRADSGLRGFRSSVQPILAADKVRHVGEPIAACVASTRALAEDLAEAVAVEFDELPAVSEMTRARAADAPLLHADWDENVFLETAVDTGFDAAIREPRR